MTTRAPFHQARRGWQFQPPQWNWGSTCRITSDGPTSAMRSKERLVQKKLAWVRTAPLGFPVVPDV